MNATDELRALLDERGVEWTDGGYPSTATGWCANGVVWHGLLRDGTIELVAMLTPEQTIAATLGSGECRMDYLCDGYLYFKSYWCRECDERFAYRLIGHDDALPKYCPNCGRKVVGER